MASRWLSRRTLDPAAKPGGSLHALEDRRDALADADAHRGEAERGVAVDHV